MKSTAKRIERLEKILDKKLTELENSADTLPAITGTDRSLKETMVQTPPMPPQHLSAAQTTPLNTFDSSGTHLFYSANKNELIEATFNMKGDIFSPRVGLTFGLNLHIYSDGEELTPIGEI